MAREGAKAQAVAGAVGAGAEAVLVRSQSSVELKRDSKGAASYTVKAYADTMDEALEQAITASGKLDEKVLGGQPAAKE